MSSDLEPFFSEYLKRRGCLIFVLGLVGYIILFYLLGAGK